MEREDKIALSVISVVIAVATIGCLLLVRWVFGTMFNVIDLAGGGVGWRSAFFSSIGLSFLFVVIFALVAGDGLVGELSVMMISFFIMILFFTASIAIIL